MDEVYSLVSEGIVLAEFQDIVSAHEFREYVSQYHPRRRYWVVADDIAC